MKPFSFYPFFAQRRKKLFHLPPLGIILLFSLFCSPLVARGEILQDSPKIRGIRVGINGIWKAGVMTPVFVFIDSAKEEEEYLLELRSLDSDKTPTQTKRKVRYQGTETALYSLFLPGQASADLEVAIFDSTGTYQLASRKFSPTKQKYGKEQISTYSGPQSPDEVLFLSPVPSDRPVWLNVPRRENGLEEVAAIGYPDESIRPIICPVDSMEDLPEDSLGYDAVDLLVLSASQESFFSKIPQTEIRYKAIQQWVEAGGSLVITGGGMESLPILNGPLSRFLPGSFKDKTREIRISSFLVQFVPNSKNLVMTGTLDHPFLNVPVLNLLPENEMAVSTVLKEGETPFITRQIQSFGTISFFALDTAVPPLSTWNGRSGLWMGILGITSDREAGIKSDMSIIGLGYSDLSGQIRSTLDHFEQVKNIPFSIILILIGLYVLVIGPIDWLITHKLFKRPNLTWITFPLWLLLFSVTALFVGSKISPKEEAINVVELIDFDGESSSVRGAFWAGVFSPSDQFYQFKVNPLLEGESLENTRVTLNWLGLSGSGLGATEQKTLSVPYWDIPYETVRTDGQLGPVPFAVRSSKSFFGEWFSSTPFSFHSELSLKSDYLLGTITNSFHQKLENLFLFYGKYVYKVGDLAPGESFTFDRKTPKVDAIRVLTGGEDPFEEGSGSASAYLNRYNTSSNDIATILNAISFHKMAGGTAAIHLANERHHSLDMSELMRNGRAVLSGSFVEKTSLPTLDLSISAEDQAVSIPPHPVFFRIVCPVAQSK